MKRWLLLLFPAVVLSFALWFFSPVKRLERRMQSLFETAEVTSTMSDLGRTARGRNLAEYLAPEVTIEARPVTDPHLDRTILRDALCARYSGLARACQRISIDQVELTGTILDEEHARIRFSVDALVELSDRRPVDGLLQGSSEWRKIGGAWKLHRISWTESPRRTP